MRQRILLLDTGKEWGGGTNSMLELLKRVDRSRFEIHAMFLHDYARGAGATIGAHLAQLGIPFTRLTPPHQPLWAKAAKEALRALLAGWRMGARAATFRVDLAWRIRPLARRIAAALRAGDYALLYLNNQPSSNLEGILAAAETNVACVQHCRIEAALNAYEAEQTNRAVRRIICVSGGIRDHLVANGIREELCAVVHNGIDMERPPPAPAFDRAAMGMSPATVVVGSIGSLIRRKGFDVLIDAFAEALRVSGADARLVIAGEGAERLTLERQVERLGLAGRVDFLGFVENGLSVSAGLDVAVLASYKEGLPRVILEAMALGKPVIASDIVGSRELVREGETGFLFAPGDRQALAERLARLIRDRELRGGLGEAGRRRAAEHFGIGQYVEGVQRIWCEVIQEAAARRNSVPCSTSS